MPNKALLLAFSLVIACGLGVGAGPLWHGAKAQDETGGVGKNARIGRSTGLPVPRFVSLKKSEVNVRIGPGENYAVKWVYVRAGLPVEVTAEHNHWRKIRDRDGEEGWVYYALLDGDRTGIVAIDRVTLWRKPGSGKNTIIAYADPGVVVTIKECSPGWCRVEVQGYKGWMNRIYLWGLYDGELFD